MRIAVLGAGAIGCLVAGYLKDKGEVVFLVGRSDTVTTITEKNLEISGVRGNFKIKIDIAEKLDYQPDVVILCTKTQDIDAAIKDNLKFIQNTTVLTTQNGIQADNLVAKYLIKENIISSIIMFGATYLEPGKIVHNFEGKWIVGRVFGKNEEKVVAVSKVLDKAFPTLVTEDLKAMKYLKIFVNANNCIPAILGMSMQEAFSDIEISQVGIAIWEEGLEIVNKVGIELVSLPDFPLERLTKLTSLPLLEAAKIFSGIMVNLSKEPLFGSILQSIKRGRPSEIDYINGEFVNLARDSGLRAPLNEKLVEMVHRVERTNKFFTKEQLISEIEDFIS